MRSELELNSCADAFVAKAIHAAKVCYATSASLHAFQDNRNTSYKSFEHSSPKCPVVRFNSLLACLANRNLKPHSLDNVQSGRQRS